MTESSETGDSSVESQTSTKHEVTTAATTPATNGVAGRIFERFMKGGTPRKPRKPRPTYGPPAAPNTSTRQGRRRDERLSRRR